MNTYATLSFPFLLSKHKGISHESVFTFLGETILIKVANFGVALRGSKPSPSACKAEANKAIVYQTDPIYYFDSILIKRNI